MCLNYLCHLPTDTSTTGSDTLGGTMTAQATASSSAAETPAGGDSSAAIGYPGQTAHDTPYQQQQQRREVSPIRKGRFSVVTHKPDEVEEITTGVIGLEELVSTPSAIGATALRVTDFNQSTQPSMFHLHQNSVAVAAAASSSSAPTANDAQLQANISSSNLLNDADIATAVQHQQQQEFLQRRFSQGILATIPGQNFHGAPVFVTTGPAIQVILTISLFFCYLNIWPCYGFIYTMLIMSCLSMQMLIDGSTAGAGQIASSPSDEHQRYLEKLGRPSSSMSTSVGQVLCARF